MTSMAQHIDQVLARASDPGAAARSRLAASWRRSLDHYGLDPGQRSGVRRVTQAVLDERLERSEGMLRIATPKIDALFQMVGSSGCGVLLTDDRGVVLDLRASAGDREAFDSWGLAPGADWSEASEGTNGIGTCIAEGRQVIIHRGDHFHARNTAMSCMDAPIFGPEGDLIGALDVSSARADQTEAFNQLIAAMVAQTARQIEADTFRATFPEARIIVVDAAPQVGLGGGTGAQDSAMLLAVDGDDIVRGATRGARRAFRLAASGPVDPRPASDLLRSGEGEGTGDSGLSSFEKAERAAVVRALSRSGGNVSQAARSLNIGRATLYRRMGRLGLNGKMV
ncbi:GAF domain-containing protein [Pseudooceanicola nitratireducens]|uniref:GAF domain-containing protein n=1 Tax=Pseudooceanicola nitratireducens TaxID=517719 RepID=UPI001C97BE6D|nr:GAF domain-containing protein [Pseudooceanicola nitratireducens]MBY6158920.1 GAF domain-containing protein [Pseudooceanicola nitratireducens]